MAVPAIIIREDPAERRDEDRWRVRLGARGLDDSSAGQSLTILNLSTSGLLFETEQPLNAGSALIVEMPNEVSKICKTVWNSGKLYGAEFSERLSHNELQNLIRSSCVVWPSFGGGRLTSAIGQRDDPSSEIFNDPRIDEGDKFPGAMRLIIVVGTSAALWGIIGFGIRLAST